MHTLSYGHTEWIRRIAVQTAYFARASKDETIVIWNLEHVKKKALDSGRDLDTTAGTTDDCIVQVLNEHEHVIDVICWAPAEAAKTI